MFLWPHQWEVSKSPDKLCYLCVFVPVIRYTHPNQRSVPSRGPVVECQTYGPLVLHALCNHSENLSEIQENPSSYTYLKDVRSGVQWSCCRCVPLEFEIHINPGLLDSEVSHNPSPPSPFLKVSSSISFECGVLVLLNDRTTLSSGTPIFLLPSQVSHSLISLYVRSVQSTLIPRFRGQAP